GRGGGGAHRVRRLEGREAAGRRGPPEPPARPQRATGAPVARAEGGQPSEPVACRGGLVRHNLPFRSGAPHAFDSARGVLMRVLSLIAVAALLAAAAVSAQRPAFAPVTQQMLENPSPDDWLMYSRTYDAHRF